jgi:hypothetical protein
MAAADTPASIRERFHDERKNIARYVEFLKEKSAITDAQVREVNTVLSAYKLRTIAKREQKSRPRNYSHDDIMPLLSSIKAADPIVKAEIEGRKAALAPPADIDDVFSDEDDALLCSQWVEHLQMEVSADMTEAELATVRDVSVRQAQEHQAGDVERDPSSLASIIGHALQIVLHNKKVEAIQELTHVLWHFNHLTFVARTSIPDAEINILRQGFILLMTAFDAAIFDLVRVALQANFFGLIPVFGKDAKEGKINLKDLGQFQDFGEFADNVIESQLKTRYIKDVLHVLKSLNLTLVDEPKGATFGMLIELVLRRNVHVHNRGRVDERYLERDEKGTPRWNIDKLQVGETARIEHGYWHRSLQLCSFCVDAVADWVEQGAGFYDHHRAPGKA